MLRFAEVVLWLSLGVTVTWVTYALAEPIYLHSCNKTTCEPGDGLVASDFLAREITGVADSIECPDKCSVAHYSVGQVHVLGNWLDISCRAWGGAPCMWDRKTYSEELLRHLQENRIR